MTAIDRAITPDVPWYWIIALTIAGLSVVCGVITCICIDKHMKKKLLAFLSEHDELNSVISEESATVSPDKKKKFLKERERRLSSIVGTPVDTPVDTSAQPPKAEYSKRYQGRRDSHAAIVAIPPKIEKHKNESENRPSPYDVDQSTETSSEAHELQRRTTEVHLAMTEFAEDDSTTDNDSITEKLKSGNFFQSDKPVERNQDSELEMVSMYGAKKLVPARLSPLKTRPVPISERKVVDLKPRNKGLMSTVPLAVSAFQSHLRSDLKARDDDKRSSSNSDYSRRSVTSLSDAVHVEKLPKVSTEPVTLLQETDINNVPERKKSDAVSMDTEQDSLVTKKTAIAIVTIDAREFDTKTMETNNKRECIEAQSDESLDDAMSDATDFSDSETDTDSKFHNESENEAIRPKTRLEIRRKDDLILTSTETIPHQDKSLDDKSQYKDANRQKNEPAVASKTSIDDSSAKDNITDTDTDTDEEDHRSRMRMSGLL